MSTILRKLKVRGFTLIELLVVIAIIAILAAILFPAINSALVKASMARTKADGRSIYISVFAKDLDDAVIQSTDTSFPEKVDWQDQGQTSTDYLRYLVTNEIMNVTFSFFAPKGVVPYKGNDPNNFEDENNGWCVVQDLLDSTPDGTPFLFTRNLDILLLDDEKTDLRSRLDGDRKPFGDNGLVVVYKGGQALEFTSSQVTYPNFNPSEQSNDVLRTGFY